jgi:hypothetical protein
LLFGDEEFRTKQRSLLRTEILRIAKTTKAPFFPEERKVFLDLAKDLT